MKQNNELSSTYVSAVEQDCMGFMWFGTTNGLQRFDGYEFKKYLLEDEMNFGINEYSIVKLFSDSKGRFWISLNANLCRYNFLTDSIKVISNDLIPNGLKTYFIKNYAENSDSTLFVSDINTIYQYNENSNSFSEIFSLKTGEIANFCFDQNNNLWIGSSTDGVYFVDGLTKKTTKHHLQDSPATSQSVSDLLFHQNKLWIATNGAGVFSYDTEKKVVKNYTVDSEYALNVRDLYVDKEGYLWLIDYTGLKIYVADRDFFQGYYPDSKDDYSIKPYVSAVFQDVQFNYWTAHFPGGVGFCPQPKGFHRFDSKVNSPFRLSVDQVSAISEDIYGNLFMGNPFNGIDVFNWTKGRTQTYNHSLENPSSLGKGATQDIFQDSRQRIWVGTYWGGLQQFRNETENFVSYLHNDEDINSISSNDIRAITEDKQGNIWVCSHGTGIDKFDVSTGKFTNYNVEKNNLSNNYTFDIICDSDNNIWVATAWGLNLLRPGETKFTNFIHQNNDPNSLSSNVINTVFEDGLKRIWVGTPKGINLYKPETNNFEDFSNGFLNSTIISITDDEDHNIWVGTLFGISRFNYEKNTVLNLTKDDGLISNDLIPRSIFNNGKNTIFFGSLHGITYFDPRQIKYNHTPPKIYFTKFRIQNVEQNIHTSKVLESNIINCKHIKINYSQKVIGFEFSALNYVNSTNNSYACFLEGFEKSWNYIGNKREATYTNLNPGKYVFRVKAANNEGVWNETGISIELEVTPPYWETWWFRTLILLIVIFIFFAYIHLRERKLLNDKIELENKVLERTKEIIEQNIQLENQKLELQKANDLKNRFYSILAHDLRGPVYSLVQLVTLLKQKTESPGTPINPKIIEMIDHSAQNTYNLLEDLLLWGKAQSKNIHLEFEEIHLETLVENITSTYYQQVFEKSIRIKNNVPDRIMVYVDKNSLKAIFRNLISNAIKFSYPKQEIIILAEQRENDILISIQDFGVGVPKSGIDLLFDSSAKHSTTGTSGEKGTGLGLSITAELVKQNNGEIWVESEPEKGSIFYFTLKARKNDDFS